MASLLVAIDHGDPRYLASAYFVVDMFFALSGFVLTKAFADKLRSDMSFITFLKLRAIRLLPLFWTGLGLGLFTFVLWNHRPIPIWSKDMFWWLVPSLFMLPDPFGLLLYPLNFPFWTLFYEVLINTVMALVLYRLGNQRLLLICVVAFILLGFLASYQNAIDPPHAGALSDSGFNKGPGWSGWYVGALRAVYAFVMGMLISRVSPTSGRRESIGAYAILAAFAGVALVRLPPEYRVFYGMFGALVLMPTLMLLAARIESPPRLRAVNSWFASISFGIFAVHFPLTLLTTGLFSKLHLGRDIRLPFYLIIVVIAGYLVTRFIDVPARSWLNRKLAPASAKRN